LEGDVFARFGFSSLAAVFPAVGALQIRYQQDGDSRQDLCKHTWKGGDWLLQILLEILFAHRNGGAEIGEFVRKRNHLRLKALRKLADAQPGEIGCLGHWLDFILAGGFRTVCRSSVGRADYESSVRSWGLNAVEVTLTCVDEGPGSPRQSKGAQLP